MQPFFSNYDPAAQEKIEHIHQDLLNIMRLHQAQQRSCTVAGAINVQQLLYEIRRESDRGNSLNGSPSNLDFTPAPCTAHHHNG